MESNKFPKLTREQALEKWGWNELKWDEKLWGPLIEIKKEVTKHNQHSNQQLKNKLIYGYLGWKK